MITQYDVHAIVHDYLPDLSDKVYPTRLSLVVYSTINDFSDYTHHALENNDIQLAKKCFAIADKLYAEGDRVVRITIESSFIHTLASVMETSLDKMFMMKAMLPGKLYALALKQMV